MAETNPTGEGGQEVNGKGNHDGGGGEMTRTEGRQRELERRAQNILDRAPRPLPGEGPNEYAERGHAAVMERAAREGGPELAREVLRQMEKLNQRRLNARAEGIARAMPPLPRPEDHRRARECKVLAWREWIGRVRLRVVGDAELSAQVQEVVLAWMGLADDDPGRAARNARDLLSCGMGEIGMTPGAAEVLERLGPGNPVAPDYLIDEYVRVWTKRGEEIPVAVEVGGEMLVVGMREAIRVNIWLRGEPGTPPVTGEIRKDGS